VLAFQLALGRTNELDLTQVNLFDADANAGRLAFMDPQRGRCNVCHFNAGANSQDSGKNRNFDTFTRLTATANFTPTFDGVALLAQFTNVRLYGNRAFAAASATEVAGSTLTRGRLNSEPTARYLRSATSACACSIAERIRRLMLPITNDMPAEVPSTSSAIDGLSR
jgi:hypothetical protein